MIESINFQLREITKTRGHFPTDNALVKLLCLGCRDLEVGYTPDGPPAAPWPPAAGGPR